MVSNTYLFRGDLLSHKAGGLSRQVKTRDKVMCGGPHVFLLTCSLSFGVIFTASVIVLV